MARELIRTRAQYDRVCKLLADHQVVAVTGDDLSVGLELDCGLMVEITGATGRSGLRIAAYLVDLRMERGSSDGS